MSKLTKMAEQEIVNDVEENTLIQKIHAEMRQICLLDTAQGNNMTLGFSRDEIERYCSSDDAFVLALQERKLEDSPVIRTNTMANLLDCLKQELECVKNDLATVVEQLEEDEEEHKRLKENCKNMEEMVAMNQTRSEDTVLKNIDLVEQNIKRRFKKEKSDLKLIMNSLFSGNSDIQDLIADIIETYFNEGPDKYRQLEYSDNIMEQLELLEKSCLFEVHPHDRLQVKLAQLL